MRILPGLFLGFATVLCAQSASTADTGLLTSKYTAGVLEAKFLPLREWQPFPKASDRVAWERLFEAPLNQERKSAVLAQAEKLIGCEWPALPATLYMEFARTGNRGNYEGKYFNRRGQLATLVIAECMEHQGRFVDDIINGVSVLLEESTWCVPAHSVRLKGDALNRLEPQSVDLFAAETAMTLATVRYLLGEELAAVSPSLVERIRAEVLRRVVEPVETTDTFGRSKWLAGGNNWAPWCASNVLGAGMLLIDDNARVAQLAVKMMGVVDRFINGYGADGGCDEGPGYWNEAPGAMLVFLELLRSRSEGFVDVYSAPKIAAMGRFIVTAHIAGPWFVNFADAAPRSGIEPAKVFIFGHRVQDPGMVQMALLAQRGWHPNGPVNPPLAIPRIGRAVLRPLMELFWMPADAAPAAGVALPTETWLPDLQMLVARETADESRGLFLAAKGGHNAESHNHNDSGHFIVWLDGQPGIIDVGNEAYTASTFGPRRYENWCVRGSAHNAPTVNGVEQAAGRTYAATDVSSSVEGAVVRLGMNLEKAYPEGSGLGSLRREWEFRRGEGASIRVRDTYSLAAGTGNLVVPLFSAREAKLAGPGRIQIACEPRQLVVRFDPAAMEARIEPVELKDGGLRASWGPRIWRITLEHRAATKQGRYEFSFAAE